MGKQRGPRMDLDVFRQRVRGELSGNWGAAGGGPLPVRWVSETMEARRSEIQRAHADGQEPDEVADRIAEAEGLEYHGELDAVESEAAPGPGPDQVPPPPAAPPARRGPPPQRRLSREEVAVVLTVPQAKALENAARRALEGGLVDGARRTVTERAAEELSRAIGQGVRRVLQLED